METDFTMTLLLTGKLAFCTTFILLFISMPVAYWLAYTRCRGRVFVEALISMPMVLPPTVLGYYLLLAFSPHNALGSFLENYFDVRLAFTFEGILIASVVAGLPFMIQPLQNGLSALPESYREASYILGKSRATTFFRVLLPNITPSLITGVALTFAHCIGEFGIVLMVGGNIPGQTRIAAIAIYDEVQTMNYAVANQYSWILFVVSFVMLSVIYSINKTFSLSALK
jgi:molybdate transport system permease protein